MNILKMFKKNDSSIILVSNLVVAVLNFSTTILLIRILGQNEFGVFIIITNFIHLIQSFLGLRTGEAIIRFVEKGMDTKHKNDTIRQLFIIDIILNSLLYILIMVSGYFYALNQSIDYSIILLFGLSVLINIGFSIFENLYIINDQIVKMHKIKLIGASIIFLMTILAGYVWHLEGVIIGMLIGFLIRNLLYFYFIKNEVPNEKIVFNKFTLSSLKKYLLFFKHTYLSSTFKSGSQGLDIFILSLALGNDKIALYEVGKKFSQVSGLFIGSIWTSKSKKIIEFVKNKNDFGLYRMITNTYKSLIPMGVILGILFYFTGKTLLIIIFGNSYANSFSIAFLFFVCYWFANLLGGFGRIYFISLNKPKMLTWLNGVLFFNILSIGYLVKDNLIYMALTICLTVLFNSFYINYFAFKRYKLQLNQGN